MSAAATVKQSDPKITVIYDNRVADKTLKEGFGFSCLVEWDREKILFDTGGDKAAFLRNITKLGIKLDGITKIIFSHHHWDHTAGMTEILGTMKAGIPVYIPSIFSAKVENQIPKGLQVVKVEEFQKIAGSITSFVLEGRDWCWSIHEQFLVLDTEKGLVIITGCAHPGIVRIIETAKAHFKNKNVHLVMGGFHLHHSFACTSAKVVTRFQQLQVEKVAPCHCAGDTNIAQFEAAYRKNFIRVGTGTILNDTKKPATTAADSKD
jgi:7,8-dihydropterin-6-yl-methyl-4-(beta-D-ribofuranosyl)aminobenzene 5'-phosphate synthase